MVDAVAGQLLRPVQIDGLEKEADVDDVTSLLWRTVGVLSHNAGFHLLYGACRRVVFAAPTVLDKDSDGQPQDWKRCDRLNGRVVIAGTEGL